MIVNQVEKLVEQIEQQQIPAGTPVDFSTIEVSNPQGLGYTVMEHGVVMGYDNFGGNAHLVVQRTNADGIPEGLPKMIPASSIGRQATIVEVEPYSETVDEPIMSKGIFSFLGRRSLRLH